MYAGKCFRQGLRSKVVAGSSGNGQRPKKVSGRMPRKHVRMRTAPAPGAFFHALAEKVGGRSKGEVVRHVSA